MRRPGTRERTAAAALRDEAGLTIVEVLIAGVIVIVSGLALLGLVDAAAHGSFRAQQSQVVDGRLQAEIEKIRQLPYSQIALTQDPSHSIDTASPDWRVSGASFALNRDGTNLQPLVYTGGISHDQGVNTVSGGTISPAPIPFASGDVRGTIYRYVTWQQDTTCANCGQPYMKHVTVAIALDQTGVGGVRAYQELQADISNPDAKVSTGGPPGGGTNQTPWTFWLTDTPCNSSTRQPIVADHLTHNTRGTCSAGLTTGNVPGAPDLMFTQAAQIDNNFPPDQQPLYDYATDVEPAQNSNADLGLQLRNGPACGTLTSTWNTLPLVPDSFDTSYFQKVHKWLSAPIPNGYNIAFNGTGTLDLWTQTLNGAVQAGKICAYLFYRQLNAQGVPVDTPAVNLDLSNVAYFTYSQNPWPTSWTEIHIPIHFNLGVALTPGTQLGLALNVDSGGTGAGGLEFLYDQPSFDSRLQVQTGNPLPF